jgi:two-component system KDP operon response regulator KdpE
MAVTLLLIDDDVSLCQALPAMLNKKEFRVEVAHNAITGLKRAYALKPDVVILDIMLPDMDGWETCRRFREMSDAPIIILSALGAEENVIKGLELGADEYIVKPVTAGELAARIHAVLRRASGPNRNDARGRGLIFTHDNLVIDLHKHEVTVDGNRVDLSPTEFRLLRVLFEHKGRLLPSEFLLTEVWGPEYIGEMDYLRVYIGYLRRKLEKDPSNPTLIQNEWGIGYRLG